VSKKRPEKTPAFFFAGKKRKARAGETGPSEQARHCGGGENRLASAARNRND
jgi:hypothetical protein